eukprot:jgi/Botrbrau1/6285/Bobra.0129s0030.1
MVGSAPQEQGVSFPKGAPREKGFVALGCKCSCPVCGPLFFKSLDLINKHRVGQRAREPRAKRARLSKDDVCLCYSARLLDIPRGADEKEMLLRDHCFFYTCKKNARGQTPTYCRGVSLADLEKRFVQGSKKGTHDTNAPGSGIPRPNILFRAAELLEMNCRETAHFCPVCKTRLLGVGSSATLRCVVCEGVPAPGYIDDPPWGVLLGEESTPEAHAPNQDTNLFRSLVEGSSTGLGPRESATARGADTDGPALAAQSTGEAVPLCPTNVYCHKQKKVLVGEQASNSQVCPSGEASGLEGSAVQVEGRRVKTSPNSSKRRSSDDEDVDICSDDEMDVDNIMLTFDRNGSVGEGAGAAAAGHPAEGPAQKEAVAVDPAPTRVDEQAPRPEGTNPLEPKASVVASQDLAESTGQGEGSVSIDVQGLPKEQSLPSVAQEADDGPAGGTSAPGITDSGMGPGTDAEGDVAAILSGGLGLPDGACGPSNKIAKSKSKEGPQPPKKPRSAYILFSVDYRKVAQGMDFNSATLAAAKAWNALPQTEKEAYAAKAKEEKDAYTVQYKEYSEKRAEYDREMSLNLPAGAGVLSGSLQGPAGEPQGLAGPVSTTVGAHDLPASTDVAKMPGMLAAPRPLDPRLQSAPAAQPILPVPGGPLASDPMGLGPTPVPLTGPDGIRGEGQQPRRAEELLSQTTAPYCLGQGAIPLGAKPPEPPQAKEADGTDISGFLSAIAAQAPPGLSPWEWLGQVGGMIMNGPTLVPAPPLSTAPEGSNAEAGVPGPAAGPPSMGTTSLLSLLMGSGGLTPGDSPRAKAPGGVLAEGTAIQRPPTFPEGPDGVSSSLQAPPPSLSCGQLPGQIAMPAKTAVPLGAPAVPVAPPSLGAAGGRGLVQQAPPLGPSANKNKFADATVLLVPGKGDKHGGGKAKPRVVQNINKSSGASPVVPLGLPSVGTQRMKTTAQPVAPAGALGSGLGTSGAVVPLGTIEVPVLASQRTLTSKLMQWQKLLEEAPAEDTAACERYMLMIAKCAGTLKSLGVFPFPSSPD